MFTIIIGKTGHRVADTNEAAKLIAEAIMLPGSFSPVVFKHGEGLVDIAGAKDLAGLTERLGKSGLEAMLADMTSRAHRAAGNSDWQAVNNLEKEACRHYVAGMPDSEIKNLVQEIQSIRRPW